MTTTFWRLRVRKNGVFVADADFKADGYEATKGIAWKLGPEEGVTYHPLKVERTDVETEYEPVEPTK